MTINARLIKIIDMKISILGPKGTFCDKAAYQYANDNKLSYEPVYFNTIDECVNALQNDESTLCVVPIENTLDGYVQKTLDLLLNKDVFIINQIAIPVQFKLISSVPETDIKVVYGQFKALNQCRGIINRLNLQVIETESNMVSYYKYLQTKGEYGALVPVHLDTSKISYVNDKVTDSNDNYTRFIVLKKGNDNKLFLKEGKKVIIPLFVIPSDDHPGLLFNILEAFNVYEINLASIMSRPTKIKMGTYNFYLEIECDYLKKDDTIQCLDLLKKRYNIKVLGEYSHN